MLCPLSLSHANIKIVKFFKGLCCVCGTSQNCCQMLEAHNCIEFVCCKIKDFPLLELRVFIPVPAQRQSPWAQSDLTTSDVYICCVQITLKYGLADTSLHKSEGRAPLVMKHHTVPRRASQNVNCLASSLKDDAHLKMRSIVSTI